MRHRPSKHFLVLSLILGLLVLNDMSDVSDQEHDCRLLFEANSELSNLREDPVLVLDLITAAYLQFEVPILVFTPSLLVDQGVYAIRLAFLLDMG